MSPMTTAYPRRAGRHQRPLNHPPAEGSTLKRRWAETHESLIVNSGRALNYSAATARVKAEEESITVRGAQVLPLCENPAPVIPLQWQLINMDPLLLICCLWPATITNNGIIAMAITVPILIVPRRRKRRRRKDGRRRRGRRRRTRTYMYALLHHHALRVLR